MLEEGERKDLPFACCAPGVLIQSEFSPIITQRGSSLILIFQTWEMLSVREIPRPAQGLPVARRRHDGNTARASSAPVTPISEYHTLTPSSRCSMFIKLKWGHEFTETSGTPGRRGNYTLSRFSPCPALVLSALAHPSSVDRLCGPEAHPRHRVVFCPRKILCHMTRPGPVSAPTF